MLKQYNSKQLTTPPQAAADPAFRARAAAKLRDGANLPGVTIVAILEWSFLTRPVQCDRLKDMDSHPLSPQSEQFIAEALSSGAFASRESLLDAAVDELRAARADEEDSLRRCDQAMSDLDAGLGTPWNPDEMKRLVREARQSQPTSTNRAAS